MIPNFTVPPRLVIDLPAVGLGPRPSTAGRRARRRSALGLRRRPLVLQENPLLLQLVHVAGAGAQPVLESVVVVLAPVGGRAPHPHLGGRELVGRLGHLALPAGPVV